MNLTEFFYPFNFLSAVIFYTVIFHRMVLTLFFTALIWVREMFSICFAITFVWGVSMTVGHFGMGCCLNAFVQMLPCHFSCTVYFFHLSTLFFE